MIVLVDNSVRLNLGYHTVTREDTESFMHDVANGKTAGKFKTKPRGLARVRGGMGTASRTVGLRGAIFEYALRHRMRPDNPTRGIIRPADGRRERRLTDDEYMALGKALRKADDAKMWPAAIAAVRFLTLTGWRSGEVVALHRAEVDEVRRTALLADSKTGRSMRPLSQAACRLLKASQIDGSERVFPGIRGRDRQLDIAQFWKRIAKLGAVPSDVTPHTLRHTFASVAADLGYSEPTIATLIGHKGRTITARYIHSADAVLLAAADAVARRILELMGESKTGVLITLGTRRRRA
jgi:integrase